MSTRLWRNSQKDSLNKAIRMLDEKKNTEALPIFETLLNSYPNEDFIKFNYAKCALQKTEKHEEAYRLLGQVYTNNKKIQDISYYMALAAYYNNNFLEALNYVSNFINAKKQSPDLYKIADALKQKIVLARYYTSNSSKVQVGNLGNSANSEVNDFNLVLTADENLKLFSRNENLIGFSTSTYLKNNKSNSQIFKTKTKSLHHINENYLVGEPQLSNIEQAKLRLSAISNDAHEFYFQNNEGDSLSDIYASYLIGNKISDAKKIKGSINTNFWEGSANLSADGKTLFFCSDRPGGKGGKDIYSATLSEDSTWTNITNLGDSINTEFDEESPFLMPDGKTFYFSSKGWYSMGGFDVYKSKYNSKEITFSKPENLSTPINSIADDLYFVLRANGHKGYFSSNRKGGHGLFDIFTVETEQSYWSSLCLVKGKISFRNKAQGVNIKIEINGSDKKEFSTIQSNNLSGNYLVCLPVGETYKFSISEKGFKVQSFEIDLTDITGYLEKTKNISLEKLADAAPLDIVNNITSSQKSFTVAGNSTKLPSLKNDSMKVSKLSKPSTKSSVENKKDTLMVSSSSNTFSTLVNNQEPKLSDIKTLVLSEKLDTDKVGNESVLSYSTTKTNKVLTINSKNKEELKTIDNNPLNNLESQETTSLSPSSMAIDKNKNSTSVNPTIDTLKSDIKISIAPISDSIFSKPKLERETSNSPTKTSEKVDQTNQEASNKNNALVNDKTTLKPKIDSLRTSKFDSLEVVKKSVEKIKTDSLTSQNKKTTINNSIAPIFLPTKPTLDTVNTAKLITTNEKISKSNSNASDKVARESEIKKSKEVSTTNKTVSTKNYAFASKNPIHLKTQDYIEKYGDFSLNELEYKIQITAFKKNNGYDFPHLAKFGVIREVQLGDGFTRLEIGPTFKTLREAFELNKQIVEAGQPEAYVVAVYKGKRYAFEELEFIEVYK